MVKELVSTVTMGSGSKEGLSGGVKDDSWLHQDLNDRKVVRKINRKYRTQKKDIEKSEVELILSKGVTGRQLNRAKLVKRATQVRGKDGKMYTRMQWVDPNKDMPTMEDSSPQEDVSKPKASKVDIDFWDGQDDVLEATKVKVYDTNTQKGFIDKQLDGISKEEKQAMISKFGIEWKRNQHDSIDWKNAVMALKKYMYENPSLLGADHLPKESNGKTTLSGTDRINDFCNKLSREDQYTLMNKYGIYDDVDPRNLPEYASKSEGGDGTGAIRHMKNMMALKKYLGENPHLMDDTDTPTPPKKESKAEPKEEPKKTPAQKGNNDMDTILKTMSDVDKYNLMRKCGITDTDPRQDPRYDKLTGDGTGAIRHMRNMMQLKKHLALHPEDLADKLGDEGVAKEKEKAKETQVKEEKSTEVKDLMGKLSKESKLALLKRFANEPEIKNRDRKDNPSIDYMRSMMALKSFLEKNPDKLAEVGDMAEFDELMSFKVSVKMLEKILRDIVGITSTQMDYAVVVEKGKEWKFGISSFAMIQTNDDGQPVLSVVDTGDDGAGWEEYEYPMSQIRDFVNKAKKDKAKAKEEAKDTVTRNEIPLHKKSISDIEKTLNKGVDEHYTSDVGEVMKPILAHYWDAVGHVNNVNDVANKSYMTYDTMVSLLEKYDVPVDSKGYFDSNSDEWMRIACHDKITSTKTTNANDYMFVNKYTGDTSAFALKESAKQWTPEERYEARGELISSKLSLGDAEQPEFVHKSLSSHITDGTMFAPFDLMTDMMAAGLSFTFDGDRGCHYNKSKNFIKLDSNYLNADLLQEGKRAFAYQPKGCHPMGEACAHEFAHAIDGYFTDPRSSGYLSWNTPEANKYMDGKYRNCVRESYYSKVDKSNPAREMVKISFNGIDSYYHKDEWINVYEGRVYGAKDTDFTDNGKGTLLDTKSGSASAPMNGSIAVEHWSENVSRYAKAFDLFKQYKEENPSAKDMTLDDWSKKMYDEYKSKGYGDDYTQEQGEGYSYANGEGGEQRGSYKNRDENPMQTTGYLYHRVKENYPIVWEGINHILNRPDFKSDKSTPSPTQLADKGEFARKSLLIVRR